MSVHVGVKRAHVQSPHAINMSISPNSSPSRANLTYPHLNLKDNTLDEQSLEQTCPLDIGKHRLEPTYDLGRLEILPYELLADVLAQLDLQSFFDFRRVNQRAMQAVSGVPQFKQILKHHLNVVRAVLATQVGSYFSCDQLLHTLRSPNCELCGDFAGYIYVLDCSRVCFLCFTEVIRYLPLPASQVCRKFGIDKSGLQRLPRLNSLSGNYSPNDKTCAKRLVLYDHDSACRAGIALHGSQAAMIQLASDSLSRKMEDYERRRLDVLSGVPGPKPRRPIGASAEYDGQSSNPHRFMAVVRAPWLSSTAVTPVSGFHCMGCRGESRARPLHFRRKFTEETFQEHLRQCGSIRNAKHNSLALPPANDNEQD